jgi:hypothetical protein
LVQLDRKPKVRPSREQRLQGAHALDARKLMAKAKVDSGAEGDVVARPPLHVETPGIFVRLRVHAGRNQYGHDLLALLYGDTVELDIVAYEAWIGKLHR